MGGDEAINSVMTEDLTENSSQKKYKKVIVTGNVIEIYEMDEIPYQMTERYQAREKLDWISEWESEIQERRSMTWQEQLEYTGKENGLESVERFLKAYNGRLVSSIMRTRNNIRRLTLANFDCNSKFITFTLAEHITDIGQANLLWRAFIREMRRKYGKFKYLAVIEFTKAGRVHYHCIWELGYIKKKELADVWGNGFVKINRIKHVDNIGAYIVKYMTKDLMDERFSGNKAYQCSQGLERPLELRGEQADMILKLYDLENRKKVFESSYTSEHHGLISYTEYNLKRD